MATEHNKRVAELAVALAIAVAAVACSSGAEGRDATTPARKSPRVTPETISGPLLLDLATGERTPLAENLAGGRNYVASPDATRLVYGTCCSGADVTTVANIDGSEARTLDAPQGLNYYGARWSPDGTKLVYQQRNGGGDNALTGDVGNLFVEDLSSGDRTQLTDLKLKRAWWWFLSPSFSSDGRKVIFHLPRSKSHTTKWDVWSVPVTGGKPKLVLRNAAFPMLRLESPEGEELAFVSPMSNDFAGHSLMSGPRDGHFRTTQVQANRSIEFPTRSPDGHRIAYQDVGSIYVFDFLTHESSKVADGSNPEWLDDVTLIVTPP